MKNILLLIPELGKGGAQRSLSKLSVLLCHYNITICTFHNDFQQVYPVGGPVISLGAHGGGVMKKIFHWRTRIRKLKQLKREHQIDICVSFLEGANYLNVLSRQQDKVILSVRGSKQHDGKIKGINGWLRKRVLIPRLFRKADKIVAVSEGIAGELTDYFGIRPNKIVVINNWYDVEEISALSQVDLESTEKPLFNKKTIIFSGRLDIQKEPLGLIKAFIKAKEEIDARLIILGDGPLKDAISDLAKRNSLTASESYNSDIVFMGFQKNPFRLIKQANLFVLSSSWEGFPNSLAEAMICRTAVLSTDCPTGPREIFLGSGKSNEIIDLPLKTSRGILMPLLNSDHNIEIWSAYLKKYLENYPIDAVENGFNYMQTFSPESNLKQWENLLETL